MMIYLYIMFVLQNGLSVCKFWNCMLELWEEDLFAVKIKKRKQ